MTHGDSSLAELLVSRHGAHHGESLRSTMAYVWDSYGLADGRMNPTSHHYGDPNARSGYHVTVAPTLDEINGAMNDFLRPILDKGDRWMLDIPRILNPGKSTSDLVVSADGGAALMMPMAAFGTLFRWNELTIIGNLGFDRAGRQTPTPDGSLSGIVGYLYAGGALPAGVAEQDVDQLLMMLDTWRVTEDGGRHRTQIWEYTVLQQATMILHEFGHIRLMNAGVPDSPDPLPPSFVQLRDEMAVDQIASEWIVRAADSLLGYLPDGRRLASDAVWFLFILYDVVNDLTGQPVDKRDLCVRFIYLLADLGALDRYQHFGSAFERITAAVGGRSRRELTLFEYDTMIQYARRLLADRTTPRPSSAPVPDFFAGARSSLGLTFPAR